MKLLLDTLKECKSIVSTLGLYGSSLYNDQCMAYIGEFIQFGQHLQTLFVNDNNITDKGIETLSDFIIGNTTLKTLWLSGNHEITDLSAPFIVEMIKGSHISAISTWNLRFSYENIQLIQKALAVAVDQREVPVKSNTKSAAKISA